MSMLKCNDRKKSAQSIENFIGFLSENKIIMDVDVVVKCDDRYKFFYNIPCCVEYENYPNNENSYSIDIWWTQATKEYGNAPKQGFPCEPFKSYFNVFYYDEDNDVLYFYNTWKEQVKIYIFRRSNECDNREKIEKMIYNFM